MHLPESRGEWEPALAGAPLRAHVWSVFADWLEERGLCREADLLRLECSLRGTSVTDPAYWKAAPTRDALRKAASEERLLSEVPWLHDYEPVFLGRVPQDWRGRWRVLRAFVGRWFATPVQDVTQQAGQTEDTPPSVRELVNLCSEFPWMWFSESMHIRTLASGDLGLLSPGSPGPRGVISRSDFGLDDPPVYEPDAASGRSCVLYPSVSAFAFMGICSPMNLDPGGSFARATGEADAVSRRVASLFPTRGSWDEFLMFEGPRILVMIDPRPAAPFDLHVIAGQDVAPSAIPPELWELCAAGAGPTSGFFQREGLERAMG